MRRVSDLAALVSPVPVLPALPLTSPTADRRWPRGTGSGGQLAAEIAQLGQAGGDAA